MDDLLNRRDLADYLAGDDLAEVFAAKLGRWTGHGRSAILVALDWDPPFADVYPEPELLRTFPTAPLIRAPGVDRIGSETLLVYVIDTDGETAYAIPYPRAVDDSPGTMDATTDGDAGLRGRR